MNKSFNLNNEMRAKVAMQLTLKAVAKHGPKLGKKLQAINEMFWKLHYHKVTEVLPVDPKVWPDLIQAGVLQYVVDVTPQTTEPRQGKEDVIDNVYLCRHVVHSTDSIEHRVRREIINSPEYATARPFIQFPDRYSDRTMALKFESQQGSVPRLNNMGMLEPDSALAKKAGTIGEEWRGILDAAFKFHRKVSDVLASCRTSRQLEDVFPEAAALLPKPVVTSNAIAPKELVDSVRAMLDKGVPPIHEQAA
ncbi:hypothetical protein D9M71_67180 [compost metagenome]